MANIMINKVCNLQCEYCFANRYVNKSNCYDKNNITKKNFSKALDFIAKSNEERLGIIGGEPTLHPEFKDFIDLAIEKEGIEHIVIFSNGINYDKYYNLLHHKKVSTLINVNSPKDIGEVAYNKLVKNLDFMINEHYLKDKISLGVNIYEENQNFDFILDLVKKYSLKRLRTSVVVPNTKDKKNQNPLKYFQRMKATVLNFFKELKKLDCMPTFDCNCIPQCVFSREEREFLSEFWDYEKSTKIRCNLTDNPLCNPVIDILPNLNIVRCFGCSDEEISLEKFNNISEVCNYFDYKIDSISFRVVSDENCKNCKERILKNCMGGCIAFKKEKIDKINKLLVEELKNDL